MEKMKYVIGIEEYSTNNNINENKNENDKKRIFEIIFNQIPHSYKYNLLKEDNRYYYFHRIEKYPSKTIFKVSKKRLDVTILFFNKNVDEISNYSNFEYDLEYIKADKLNEIE